MTKHTKVHDGIIGALVLGSSAMAHFVDPRWLVLTALVAIVMLSSVVTGFCPVHFTLSRWMRP